MLRASRLPLARFFPAPGNVAASTSCAMPLPKPANPAGVDQAGAGGSGHGIERGLPAAQETVRVVWIVMLRHKCCQMRQGFQRREDARPIVGAVAQVGPSAYASGLEVGLYVLQMHGHDPAVPRVEPVDGIAARTEDPAQPRRPPQTS
jgi:hypothetical protein